MYGISVLLSFGQNLCLVRYNCITQIQFFTRVYLSYVLRVWCDDLNSSFFSLYLLLLFFCFF